MQFKYVYWLIIVWSVLLLCLIWSRPIMELITIISLIFFLFVTFSCINLVPYLFSMEIVTVLLMYAVLKYGSSFERLVSSYYLGVYSICSRVVLFIVVVSSRLSVSRIHQSVSFWDVRVYTADTSSRLICQSLNIIDSWRVFMLGLGIIMLGLVKLPLFGLHIWLPKVHVEASMVRSMILAGIALKGGNILFLYLYCMGYISLLSSSISYVVALYLLLSTLYCRLLMTRVTDSKCLVAYSSVLHITFSVLCLIYCNDYVMSIFLEYRIAHGFISPCLFILVYVTYRTANNRLISGILRINYGCSFFGLVILILFILNIGFPPFVSFLCESVIVSCIYPVFVTHGVVSSLFMRLIICRRYFILVFGMNWYLYTFIKINTVGSSVSIGPSLLSKEIFLMIVCLISIILYSLLCV